MTGSTRAITRSTRAPTSPADSPPGQPRGARAPPGAPRRPAPRAAGGPQEPARARLADLGRGDALVLAVVPLAQVVLAARHDPGQLGRIPRAPQRRAQGQAEAAALE